MIWAVMYFIMAVILFFVAMYFSAVEDARANRKEMDDGIGFISAAAIFWPFTLLLFCLYWIVQGGPAKLYQYIWMREKRRLETEEELRTRIRELERELNL